MLGLELTRNIWFVAVNAYIRTGDEGTLPIDRHDTRLLTLKKISHMETVRKLVL